MDEEMFSTQTDFEDFSRILDQWRRDEHRIKDVFLGLVQRFREKDDATLSIVSRPGISHSLRARVKEEAGEGKLIAMVDIVDDDPDDRWLSICFYGECVTDPEGEGDLVPGGLLGEDGYCFNLFHNDESFISYLEQRIDEACENTLNGKHSGVRDRAG